MKSQTDPQHASNDTLIGEWWASGTVRNGRGWGVVTLAALVFASVITRRCSHAAEPVDLAQMAVSRIQIEPQRILLPSPRSRIQLVVTGYGADGFVFDVTHAARIEISDPSVANVDGPATLHPLKDGETTLHVSYEGTQAAATVIVSGQALPAPVRFHAEVLALLTKLGCNSGSCHGSPHGKNGFQLSLLASAPQMDAESLIYDGFSRRISRQNPDDSLLLRKPTLKIPHGGHKRLREGTPPYELLRQWITDGAADDTLSEPSCVGIEVIPGGRRELRPPHLMQQLAVRATFSDGSLRDVTHLGKYETSHEEVARVNDSGLVTAGQRGDAAVSVRYLDFIQPFSVTVIHDVAAFVWSSPPEINEVDRWVNNKLRQLQYLPSETCSDGVFVRRVYLDVIGLLPTVGETRAFLTEEATDKRSKLIETLLHRPEHARFWALKTADLMRVSAKTMKEGRAEKFSQWIAETIAENMPFDRFAQTLLTASGDTLETPEANYFGALPKMEDCAEATAQIFMGSRVQCAKCHNHPFENWTQNDYYRLAAVFARVDSKLAQVNLMDNGEAVHPSTGEIMHPWGTTETEEVPVDAVDRRRTFVSWLTADDNPYFARVEVNRIWSHLFGQGIVEPVDDFRLSNPPVNDELLDGLADEFITSAYDRRHILRIILNSQTYQRSALSRAGSEEEYQRFSRAQVRLLTAEQLHDAIGRVTGTLPPSEQAIEDRSQRATEQLAALLETLALEQPAWEGGSRVRLSDVSRMSGNWFGLGPLPTTGADDESDHAPEIERQPVDFDREFPLGEAKTVRWIFHPDWQDGKNVNVGGNGQQHYLCRRIASRSAEPAEIRLRTPSELTLWLNGREICHRAAVTSKNKSDQDIFVPLELEQGPNMLLMRLRKAKGPNTFRMDIGDPGALKPIDDGEELLELARMLFYGSGDVAADTKQIPQHIGVILETLRKSRTEAEQQLLIDYYHGTEPRVAMLRDEIDRLARRRDFATQCAEPLSNEFLRTFGKPQRETACACERARKPTLLQALQLLNGPLVHERVTAGAQRYRAMGDDRLIETLYLAAYCRPPTDKERRTASAFLDRAEQRDDAVEDLIWSMINTRDFLFQY